MTDKMPDVIYAEKTHEEWVNGKSIPQYLADERYWGGKETYIRQDSINVPELLEADGDDLIERVDSARVLHGARAYYLPEDIFALLACARELQRLKGLK